MDRLQEIMGWAAQAEPIFRRDLEGDPARRTCSVLISAEVVTVSVVWTFRGDRRFRDGGVFAQTQYPLSSFGGYANFVSRILEDANTYYAMHLN